MSKSQRRFNNSFNDDFDKPHHQIKQLKKSKERKTLKKFENALRSRDVDRIIKLEDY